MARIRSVKPEFWTSEQIAECSPNARLLFVGMWNFCDDYGVHPASCARLKMEIFPADAFSQTEIRSMIDELIDKKLIVEYVIENEKYWFVTGWDKHQKPDTKTGKWPRPDGTIGGKIRRKIADNSPNGSGMVGDHSPPELVLDSCSLVLGSKNTLVEGKPSTPPCPHQEIISLYNKILPELQAVIPDRWGGQRAKHLQARWRESEKHQSLKFWENLFTVLRNYSWYLGQNDRGWSANLGWIVEKKNFDNLIEKFVTDSRRSGTA